MMSHALRRGVGVSARAMLEVALDNDEVQVNTEPFLGS